MEKVNEVIKENNKHNSNFFSYVFNFDEDNKAGMLNMMQYTLLAILPVVILLKLVKHYIPEDDESKPSLEVLVEVILQLVILFLSIWFIDKMIRFIPTYSGVCYFKFHETHFIIPVLMVLITMQTKLGAKINLLIDRINDVWSGNAGKKNQNKGQVKVTQPFAGGRAPQHMPSQADLLNMPQNVNTGNTSLISDLPVAPRNQQANNQVPQMDLGPMAANEALGGGFGSMW
jgi:hypothetical protein